MIKLFFCIQSISNRTQVDAIYGLQGECTVNEQTSEIVDVTNPHASAKQLYQDSDVQSQLSLQSKQSLELAMEPQPNEEVILIFRHCKRRYI